MEPAVKKKIKKKQPKIAAIEDELLGLAEGESRSSPMPGSDAPEVDYLDEDHPVDTGPIGPDTIVYPCGLTRAEVISKVEGNDMRGLTEADVKAVQDEDVGSQKGRCGRWIELDPERRDDPAQTGTCKGMEEATKQGRRWRECSGR